MSLELTFKSVCTSIKKHGKDDPKLIEAVDNLLGITLVCSPLVLGPAAVAALPTLAVKNELIKIGKSVFEKLTKKKDEDYLLRYETMRTAYGLLVFTSFFDALDARLPKTLRDEIALLDTEKAFLAKDGVIKAVASRSPEVVASETTEAPISSYAFSFPHPTETLVQQCERQTTLWKQMQQGFIEFVQKLAFWDGADEKKKAALLSGLDKIEKDAANKYEAQYFELSRKFEDFAVWANLQSHKGTKALIGELSDYVKYHAKLSAASEKTIDVGFGKLREAVLSIPETLKIQQGTEISESLNKHYQARVNEPIIEDKEGGDEGKPRLSFPRTCDAFVPQSFRVLRQTGKSTRLEDESTWAGLARRNDLGAFLLSYLSSPYSTETPLLILGHPGSGKSLLTTILSAQLMSKQFTAIRVPLREVNADADVVTQIEEAIRRVTGVSLDSWIKLSALFKNCPPLVILDGYDELLQASGQVFASYIKDAQRFQEREAEQGRPVRIIITSRVTLIDKAAIPVGSTIVRLLEFDSNQRGCWIGIWNKANANYFRDTGIEKFSLPAESEKDAEKILNLAEQPLLLLMLALYDSQENELRNSKGLDRTKLYDSLLRRFVIREREKEKGFDDAKEKEREKALSVEMQRLGVAALGMYNRRKVHILSNELDDDLAFFRLEREVSPKPGKTLSQADLLLGSFFFVHKAKAQHRTGTEESYEETAAFEFLHNTFGEFLTADFILRRAVSQVQTLQAAESTEALKSIMDKMMGTADGFERDWFASLVYTPLFTRPVIMEMIREWTPHVLRDHGLTDEGFVKTLAEIVQNQVKRMLNKREMPQIMRGETAQEGYRVPFGDHPLVGHIAIYSINLILLRLVAGKDPFVFDESLITSHEDGTRPWDRLIYIWRSWFSLGNLNGLTAVMLADRNETKIIITAKAKFQAQESKTRLQEFHNVALSLGDNVAAGTTGLYLFDPSAGRMSDIDNLEKRLNTEGYDLGIPVAVNRLLLLAEGLPDSAKEFFVHGRRTLETAVHSGRLDQIEQVCSIISRCFDQIETLLLRRPDRFDLRELFEPALVVRVSEYNAWSARIIFGFATRIRDVEWMNEFSGRLFERISRFGLDKWGMLQSHEGLRLLRDIGRSGDLSHLINRERLHPDELLERMLRPTHLLELSERNPEAALTYLQIVRQLEGGQFFERFVERELGPGFVDQMFSPNRLLELCERSPEAALAYVQILGELGGRQVLERFFGRERGPEFLQHMVHPHHLLEFSERNPEGALTYLQIMRQLIGPQSYERFVEHEIGPEFVDQMLHRRHLLVLRKRNPERMLAYLQILWELSGGRFFQRLVKDHLGPEFLDDALHPRHLLELSERSPERALALLPVLRELGSERVFERLFAGDRAFFESMVRHLVAVSGRNPEGALAYLQILGELGGKKILERFTESDTEPEFLDRILNTPEFSDIRMRSLSFWLAFARLSKLPRVILTLGKVLSSVASDQASFRLRMSVLPISSISDLRWLSHQIADPKLQSFVAEVAA